VAVLGKPTKKYFQQFNLEKEVLDLILNLKDNRPYDLALIINPNGFYEVILFFYKLFRKKILIWQLIY